MLKTAYNFIVSKIKGTHEIQKRKEQALVKSIVSKMVRYDNVTNTIILDIPCNLIISTNGTQLQVAHNGHIVQVAENIHLNPPVTKQTTINIIKSGRSYDELVSPLSKLIEGTNGSNQL